VSLFGWWNKRHRAYDLMVKEREQIRLSKHLQGADDIAAFHWDRLLAMCELVAEIESADKMDVLRRVMNR
jgi:hypothetical protein